MSTPRRGSKAWVDRRRAALPPRIGYPVDLPITDRRDELLHAIRDHQVVIVAGETGSGKSTQLPKLCLELGRGVRRAIGHTQPRRIAARSIAQRIAEELGTEVGRAVGYAVRFSDQTSDETLIKVMTDGLLLAEIHRDRDLRRYDTIIVDEAHERSLNIDFLLGYLTALLPKRPDLKVIVTSATIDTERFSAHFGGAPVVEVSGRTYPVEIRYRPLIDSADGEPRDQTQGICDAVEELYTEGDGDILVFCAGEREIRDAAEALGDLRLPHTEIVPLYARLSAGEQNRVFRPHTGRRVVVSTNVAETSLTVPGIRYVVDAGTARISRYSRRTKVQRLPIEPISRASADQRAGRCGRLGPGVCIRLYDEEDFARRPAFTEPEIQRTSLAAVILQMTARDLGDIETFPFLDRPDARAVRDGLARLVELQAITPGGDGGPPTITKLGRRLAEVPIDVHLARMIVEADRNACLSEVLVIASALAIVDPRERPTEKETQADQAHARFRDEASDFVTWLNLWEYLGDERRARTSNQFRRMCQREYLNYRRVREWQDLHGQLRDVVGELGLRPNRRPADREIVHRTLLAGLLSNIGRKDPSSHEYRGARGSRFSINPGSALFKKSPEWVMAAELVETTRLWARGLAMVKPEWIEAAAAHLVNRAYSDPWWDPDRGAAYTNETTTLYGIPIHTDRPVLYLRIDPAGARELFIRHALVAHEWETHHAFAVHNAAKIDEVLELEVRARRSDLLIDDEALVGFFDRRIPSDIVGVRAFDRWWKEARTEDPHLLDLSLDDLLADGAELPEESAFPAAWQSGDVAMPLEYAFEPSSDTDGVTVDVPLSGLARVDPAGLEWLVPGLREELVVTLLRTLPKDLRKRLAPIPETAKAMLEADDPTGERLIPYLRRAVTRRTGTPVPVDAFDPGRLPPHLRPRYRVVDEDGRVLAEGSDLGELRERLGERARVAVAATRHPLERDGLTSWDVGTLPREIAVEGPDGSVSAYPALIDEGASAAVRLFATPAEQASAMWEGVRRLLALGLPPPGRDLRRVVTDDGKRAVAAGPHATFDAWAEDCLTAALDAIMSSAGGPPWDRAEFLRLLDRAQSAAPSTLIEVASLGLEILDEHRAIRIALSALEADRYGGAVADIERQLASLVYDGFVASMGVDRLADTLRYLQAVTRRIDRLSEHVERDRARMERVQTLEREWEELSDAVPDSIALVEVGWMLQELRVSFFAQDIGTSSKVSEKRVRDAMRSAVET